MNDETKQSAGQQTRRAAVVIGRFNPPTVGHYKVLNVVKKFIRANPELELDMVPILVVIEGKETSKDKQRNPLTADERIAFMKGSGLADGVKFLKAGSAFAAFEAVRKAGFEPIAVAAGSDRGDNYLAMLNKYFKSKDGKDIKHRLIELPRGGSNSKEDAGINKNAGLFDILKHMDKDIPVSMVSASLARLAVQQNEREKFAIIVGLENKPNIANLLFNKIKKAMEIQDA